MTDKGIIYLRKLCISVILREAYISVIFLIQYTLVQRPFTQCVKGEINKSPLGYKKQKRENESDSLLIFQAL